MVKLSTVGIVTFPAWPTSGFDLITNTGLPSGGATATGGVEGLTLSLHDNGEFADVVQTSEYDGMNNSFAFKLPTSNGPQVFWKVGISSLADLSDIVTYWVQFNSTDYDFGFFKNGTRIGGTGSGWPYRWFKIDMLPGRVQFSTSTTGATWTVQTDGLVADDYSQVSAVIHTEASADNQTVGVEQLQFADIAPDPEVSPLTLGTARDLFRQWLDTVDYTQPQSSAVLTYQQVQAQTAGYAGTYDGITVSGDTLKEFLIALFGLMANALSILGFLQGLWPTGHLPSDHDASLEAHRAATEPEGETLPSYIEGEIEIVLSAVTDQTNEITQILAHGNGTEDLPTIVGESDWSNIFRFDVAADFYTIDITTTDIDAVVEDVAGTQVWDHLGFCIPLTVDGLPEYGPRLAIGGQVIRTGRQMGGIILNGRRVLSGHVTAYQYQAP